MEKETANVVHHHYNGGLVFQHCDLSNVTIQNFGHPAPEEKRADRVAGTLPAELDSPQARDLMDRLAKAGVLDEAWQPVGLSGAKRGVLAHHMAARLGIECTWKTFGTLWGEKSGTLRTAYNTGMEQKSMSEFIGLINNVLKE